MIIKKDLQKKVLKISVHFSKSGRCISQTKEGSRMEGTLDFDSDDLGGSF